MTTLATFPAFPRLPVELRNKIWALTFPGPRIIRVVAQDLVSKECGSTVYKADPCSCGGVLVPATLHVNRASRALALSRLAPRFDCYWNFDIDMLYIEERRLGSFKEASEQLVDMRKRGLLKGVKHLALDWEIWDFILWDPKCRDLEHCSYTLRHHRGLQSCTFILRPNYARLNRRDIVVPGVPWSVIPVTDEEGVNKSSRSSLEDQFLGRVRKAMKGGLFTWHHGPKNLSFKCIGDRGYEVTDEWKPSCDMAWVREREQGHDFFG